ncbi:N-acetylglucosamine-specific PTS transporter subunit IIBC [Arcanobacterium bovis]|uniref:N-acetylglucosamine-specific PTS transporter subunit IIBC n=1 Tax=Arcanobacterium bovis TaxID=2529275 RepID=UPI0019D61480|nr:N-acetylglucosamine-specific PTS transporter subunit IIBC [Arcanobacterium bovis]
MKDTIVGALQRFGRAIMGAVAVMPVAAILMGIGYWIDPTGWGANSVTAAILIKSGLAVLDNLGYVFAIALAFGLSRDSNGAAALSGFLGFTAVKLLLAPAAIASYRGIADYKALKGDAALEWASQGWEAVNEKNVLIGILVGILAAWCYNRFHQTKLPDFLAFFAGRRLVPIVTMGLSIVLAGVLYLVWPFVYNVLFQFGQSIQGLGAVGAGIYGLVNRLLLPTGLHHALNSIFWFDVVGINDIGNFLKGGETIKSAAAATSAATCPGVGVWNGTTCTVVGEIGKYQAGFFPVMMFGMPGAALAIYLRADKAKRKVVGSLMLAAALAAFFTGVTEPVEFSFLFVAPALYLIHAILTGISLAVAAFFHWTAGFGFSAGFVDMFLSSQNPLANKWWMLLLLGVVYFVIYLGVFYFAIGKFNLKTPGRGDDSDAGASLAEDRTYSSVASQVIAGLGGHANIDLVDYCATRLRVSVKDHLLVKENDIKAAGVAGVIRPSQKSVQVIIGPQVQFVYDEVARQLQGESVALQGEQEN